MRVELVEYDPAWPVLYAREEARIRRALGVQALTLEHVGSTAVPGLVAKPVIDILLGVRDSTDEASYLPHLEAAGYTLRLREPDWYQHRLLSGPDTDINLHVFTRDSPEVDATIRFRDRLRVDPEARQRYEEEKRRLAERDWETIQDYADAKTVIITAILDSVG